MKHLLRALLLAVAVTLCTAIFALPSAAEDFSGGFDPERFLVYEGLQARSKNDYAGLRSRYTVDDELITELVKEGHTVQYGAMMGVGSYKTTDYRHLSDLVVTYDKTTNKISFNVKNAAIAVVYDSTGKNNPSGLYTSRGEIKSSFAYTTTYKQNEMNATLLKDIAMVYRAFIIIDGNVEYVDAVGSTFGQDTATYGRTTSLYEVCTYFAEEYKTASGKPFENSVAIRNVISSCMSDSFTEEFADGLALTTNVSGCTVTVPAAKAGVYALKMKYVHPKANDGHRFTVKNTATGEIAHAKMPINTSGDGTTPAWSVDFLYLYLKEGENVITIGADSVTKLYGIELVQKVAAPVEDTAYNHVTTANSSFWYKDANVGIPHRDPNSSQGNEQKTNFFNMHSAGNTIFVRSGVTVKHTLSVNVAATYDVYFVGGASGTTLTTVANGQTKSVTAPTLYVPGAFKDNGDPQNITSEGSGIVTLKLGSFDLQKGANVLEITNNGWISFGSIVAVRKTETVTLYDQDGKTPISVQKVYDLSDVVYPSNVKVPAGYDDVAGWSDLTLVDGKYQSTVAYGKYYTVKFYD